MGTSSHSALLCLAAVAAAPEPALADDAGRAPRSLRMRERTGQRIVQTADPTPGPADAAPPVAAAPATLAAPSPEVISVRGTTIEHKLFTGRAPVSVVTRGDLAASGRATLGDILQALPMQSNASNAQVNAGGDGATRINLRGLGAPRTLVLLNGRRIVNGGAGANAAVDINAIPLAVIERVEIFKDGASAIYGADAVGGVVNLVTRRDIESSDVSLLTSTSQRGDGTEYAISAVTGFMTRDKRNHIMLSGGYQQHAAVLAGDRGFSEFHTSYDFATRTRRRLTSTAAPGGRLDVTSIAGAPGQPPGCSSDTCRPDGNGAWTEFAPADLYNEASSNYLYTPSSRFHLYATAGRRLTDTASTFLELLYLRHDYERQLSPAAFLADSPISKDSMYNTLGGDILDYRRRITELGPRRHNDRGTMFRLVLGATGRVPDSAPVAGGWRYEVSYNYGATTAIATSTGQLLKPRLAAALGPSMLDADGVPICVQRPGDASTKIIYTVEGIDPIACVPVNLLAPAGAIPRDQLDQLTFEDAGTGTNTMGTLLFTAGGRVAELPNRGEISLSLGGDYRYELGDFVPLNVAAVGYTTDLAGAPVQGELSAFEGFGELAIVPLSGHRIVEHLELDLGARASRHDRFGTSVTYKVGGLVRTVYGLAVRATRATAFRAPSVFDLFTGRTERAPAAEDPCDTKPPSVGDGTKVLDEMVQAQCTAQGVPEGSAFTTAQQVAVLGGNPELDAETAATTSVGLVVEPAPVPGLAITADYWRIAIDDAIETLGVHTIFANCYERGVQSYCDQIKRDPMTFRINPVDQRLQNIDRTLTSGVDLAVRYDAALGGIGRLRTGLEVQRLLGYDLDTSREVIHGAGYYDLGAHPRYRANLSSSWAHPAGGSAGFSLRYVGSYQECAGNNCNSDRNLAMASRDVDRYFKLDLFGGYDFGSRAGRSTIQLGINNVLDALPPVVYNSSAANSDAMTYDFVGRMAYVRLSQQF